jgi:carotenoid 1,2-hydratase
MDGLISAAGHADKPAGPLSGGRQHPSGTGRSDGGAVGSNGGQLGPVGLRFDQPVPPGGYVWWYVDGLSDDGRYGFSVIAFIGSVFSPYYYWAGRRDPENHVAINVALYGRGARRWTMTERGRSALRRDATNLVIGPSALSWDGNALTLDLDEVAVPIPRRVRGRIRLMPDAINQRSFAIDRAGRHRWMPLAPSGRVEVSFSNPALSWSGHGYFDTNAGDEPFARAFSIWDWSRADLPEGTATLYDTVGLDGSRISLATLFDRKGGSRDFEPPPRIELPKTLWRIGRRTQTEDGAATKVLKTLEDTPFYARSVIETRLCGQTAAAVHESLSVDRFDTAWVRALLPWRMPRRFL